MDNKISENIGYKSKDRRKRIRCKCCHNRVNLLYWSDEAKIYFRCPKCLNTYSVNKY